MYIYMALVGKASASMPKSWAQDYERGNAIQQRPEGYRER